MYVGFSLSMIPLHLLQHVINSHAKSGKCTHPVSYGLHVSSLPSQAVFNSVFKSASRGGPLSDIMPISGTPLMGHSGKDSSCSAHPDEPQERIDLTPGESTWTKELNHLNHSRSAVVPAVRLIGGVRVRGLGMRLPRLSWLQDGVWRLLLLLYLCAALAVCSLSFFSFSTSPSSLCLRVSIPPSPSSPSPFSLPSSAAPRLFLCLLSSQILPRLTELPALLYFSPDISVLFEVSLLSVWLENQTGVRRLVSF